MVMIIFVNVKKNSSLKEFWKDQFPFICGKRGGVWGLIPALSQESLSDTTRSSGAECVKRAHISEVPPLRCDWLLRAFQVCCHWLGLT
ncbi:hypothetical protein F2P79_006714 [Pimephales promelas]|nr:hypothetical protein F2P79_006714 [Pimephales promelas]